MKKKRNELEEMYLRDTPQREKISAFLDKMRNFMIKYMLLPLVVVVILARLFSC